MSREIVKYPDSVLKKKSEEIEEITDEIRKLAQGLKETMFANQVLIKNQRIAKKVVFW